MTDRVPEPLRPPIEVALARAVGDIPQPGALPGGSVYEPKWDGFRAVLVRDGDNVSLWSRQRKDLTRYFPDLAAAAHEHIPPGCVVDGEAVLWNDDRLDFDGLQRRLVFGQKNLARHVREQPAHFVAFDLLAVAGQDARSYRFRDRRTLLEELTKDWPAALSLSPATTDRDEAAGWLESMAASGVEGLVIKGRSQKYEGGKRQWQKIKHRSTREVVCAAVTGPIGKPYTIIAGLPMDGKFRIVGRSVPLKPAAAKDLALHLRPAGAGHPWPERIKSTILDQFNPEAGDTELTLVEPVVVEVSADTAWSGNSFRHPLRLLRARPELDPDEVQPPAR